MAIMAKEGRDEGATNLGSESLKRLDLCLGARILDKSHTRDARALQNSAVRRRTVKGGRQSGDLDGDQGHASLGRKELSALASGASLIVGPLREIVRVHDASGSDGSLRGGHIVLADGGEIPVWSREGGSASSRGSAASHDGA